MGSRWAHERGVHWWALLAAAAIVAAERAKEVVHT